MPIIKDVELHFVKCNPARPNAKFNKENPTWEAQIRTESKDKKKELEALGLKVTPVVPDEGNPYFRVNLRKKSIKADGSKAGPVEIVTGKKQPLDPDTIGNGSKGHIRIFQYEYPKPGAPGGKGKANVLMGIQVTEHKVYVPKAGTNDGFEEEDMVTIEAEEHDDGEGEGSGDTPNMTPKAGDDAGAY